ncbi:MAG: glycosyltransferase family 25 protein [Abditibacteriaceae bacterium]
MSTMKLKKVFIISMLRSQDRKLSMLHEISQIKDATMTFEFFEGVDGNSSEVKRFSDNYNSLRTRCQRGSDLTLGERGCFASHYCLWQKCVELNEPIVVIEDDVKFLVGYEEGIDRIYNSEYEYVRLITQKEQTTYTLNDNFALTYSHVLGTQGYYLTPKAAEKFLNNASLWSKSVDVFMDDSYIHKVPNIIYKPELLEDNAEHNSLIGKRRGKRRIWFTGLKYCFAAVGVLRRYLYIKSNMRQMRVS